MCFLSVCALLTTNSDGSCLLLLLAHLGYLGVQHCVLLSVCVNAMFGCLLYKASRMGAPVDTDSDSAHCHWHYRDLAILSQSD